MRLTRRSRTYAEPSGEPHGTFYGQRDVPRKKKIINKSCNYNIEVFLSVKFGSIWHTVIFLIPVTKVYTHVGDWNNIIVIGFFSDPIRRTETHQFVQRKRAETGSTRTLSEK